jgi:anhydro-N-acetylmuramic acid kinase
MTKLIKQKAIGVMSGTSLDGIDIAACEFWKNRNKYYFDLYCCQIVEYLPDMLAGLKNAHKLSGYELAKLNVEYGKLIGNKVNNFIVENKFYPDFIASHGFTVFHEPQNSMTLQIGSGAEISAITGIKTVCNFRTIDVAFGGQGAPLVPIGDKYLFNDYVACLNLGGFSNISYDVNSKKREAYDICPVNYLLNYFSEKLNMTFDKNGETGKTGKVNVDILNELNNLTYYKQKPPKSMGREFVEKEILPVFRNKIPIIDALRTSYEHIAFQLVKTLNKFNKQKILITGGGAHNLFLISLLNQKTSAELIIPERKLVDFKEALIFAFLGYLRINNINNSLGSITGAKKDNIGGAVYKAV